MQGLLRALSGMDPALRLFVVELAFESKGVRAGEEICQLQQPPATGEARSYLSVVSSNSRVSLAFEPGHDWGTPSPGPREPLEPICLLHLLLESVLDSTKRATRQLTQTVFADQQNRRREKSEKSAKSSSKWQAGAYLLES